MAVTLREVAELAGVSISTASRALSGAGPVAAETESRIARAVQELNYRPWTRTGPARGRQGTAQSSARRVGVVLRVARYKYSDPYWARVLDGLDAELARHGYDLAFTLTVDELENTHRGSLVSQKEYDALVLLGDFAQRLDVIDAGRTVVCGGEDELRWMADVHVDFITAEKRRAIYTVVSHLAALGRRRIGFLGPSPARDERAEAFTHALPRVSLPYDAALVVESPWDIDGAYEAARTFFATGCAVDALVCASDEIALATMRAARERGLRLPDDLAVTGFDDLPFASSLDPALTTVRLPREVVGAVTARRVIERITDPGRPVTTEVVPTQLIVRASCGARPRGGGAGDARKEEQVARG